MAEQKRIILYGDTLILAGVEASLSLSPNLEIIALNGSPADLAETLNELHAFAVIFDLGSVQPDFTLAILQQSDLLLIGIDPDSHQAQVWTKRQMHELSVPDLVGLINSKSQTHHDLKGIFP